MLNSEQRERLQIIHNYEWATESPTKSADNLRQLYAAIDSVEELWYASLVIPLDPKRGDWFLVLDHPLCDRGIASLMYWMLEPSKIYAEYESTGRISFLLELLEQIEARLLSAKYTTSAVRFSPTMLARQWHHKRIPSQLREDIDGIELPLNYRNAVFP